MPLVQEQQKAKFIVKWHLHSCPVGFKNGTDGNTRIAIDAIRASRVGHTFLSPDKNGRMTIYQTSGNPYGHIIHVAAKTELSRK